MDTQHDAQYVREVNIVIETQMQGAPWNQPTMKLIDAKALVLGDQVHPQADGSFLVDGAKGEVYTWTQRGCSCPQATKANTHCKHATAVELYKRVHQALGQPALPLPPQTVDERLAQQPVGLDDWPEEDFPPTTMMTDSETEADMEALAAAQAPEVVELDDTPRPEDDEPLPARFCPPVQVPTVMVPLGDASTPHPACGALHMLRSVQVSHVIGALLQAQASIKNPRHDTQNPHFKTRYASLAAVRDTLTPALTAAGLVLTQFLSTQDGAVCCETILWHPSGEYLGSTLRLPVGKADAQGYGAASTYARRYGLMALCNVVGDEDDDAETLAGRAPAPSQGRAAAPSADQLKRRIVDLLKAQGKRHATREEVQRAVLDLTGLALEERHYSEIVRRLEYYQPAQGVA